MKVAVIDYGMGNLGSVRRAFEECGAEVSVCRDPMEVNGAQRIVLPGVGAFTDGMKNLTAAGWVEKLRESIRDPEVALIGICLGMQLLAQSGSEGGETQGLCLIPGHVRLLHAIDSSERIPHVGWNEVHTVRPTALLRGIPDGTDFYFVHSYHFSEGGDAVCAKTPYGGGFASVVAAGNVFGTQFHPEKSSRPGFALLRNFLSTGVTDA